MTFGIDKLWHFLASALLTIVMCLMLNNWGVEYHYIGGLIALSIGIAKEIYDVKKKNLVKLNWGDMFFNILGVFAGWFITYTIILY